MLNQLKKVSYDVPKTCKCATQEVHPRHGPLACKRHARRVSQKAASFVSLDLSPQRLRMRVYVV